MAATAYVALVAAAISTRTLVCMDLVWAVALLVTCYAIIVACIERGRRQAMAIGFVVFASAHMLVARLHSESTPATWLYQAAGYYPDTGFVYERTGRSNIMGGRSLPQYRQTTNSFVPHPRLANAVVTLVVGLFGCRLGAIVYKHHTGKQPINR
jgi:hypothetical protein